jgi:hypothetical protein
MEWVLGEIENMRYFRKVKDYFNTGYNSIALENAVYNETLDDLAAKVREEMRKVESGWRDRLA